MIKVSTNVNCFYINPLYSTTSSVTAAAASNTTTGIYKATTAVHKAAVTAYMARVKICPNEVHALPMRRCRLGAWQT